MLLSNLEHLPGHRIVEHIGLVCGNTIRAKHVGRDIMAGLKNIVGGEIKSYTNLLTEARNQAIERMVAAAESLGANAVINVRLSTSAVMSGAAELFAYGTAVKVQPERQGRRMWADLIQYGLPLVLIAVGFVAGRIIERRHFRSLRSREAQGGPVLTNLKKAPGDVRCVGSRLCVGSVVIASDYFKFFGAFLKGLVGGRLRTLETMLDRGRREALLRMKQQAAEFGADMVLNVRLETSVIMRRKNNRTYPAAEVIAYGTAVRLCADA